MPDVKLYPEIPENPYIAESVLYTLPEGWKRYELTNHLGNVLAVITDRKRARAASGTDIQWYEADVMATQQYYPFGMLMPTSTDSSLRRQYSLDGYDYRYGFNGKEGDDEIKGDDNQQDYGMRIYDPRVGRFLSVDPLMRRLSSVSSYNYTLNNPIVLIDPDGMYPIPPGAIVGIEKLSNGNFSHISVKATVYIYGPASSDDIASLLEQQTNSSWNANNPEVSRYSYQKGTPVKFEINFINVSVDEAKAIAGTNEDKSVNFLKVIDDEFGSNSFFEGNSGVLNLAQNKIREGTTVAHEMGHMMGFRSKNQQDDSHISDDDIWNSLDGPTKIPLMYSGGEFINRIGERTLLLGQSVRKLKINHNLLVSVCNATRTVIKSPTSAKKQQPNAKN
ncbi:MAG: RHS repeat-associated core domain-containing protein [Lewinellaceae bacterium]|nr:RHS repeat-associated core domain-containing protein [Lewinellaceae bacterium]